MWYVRPEGSGSAHCQDVNHKLLCKVYIHVVNLYLTIL